MKTRACLLLLLGITALMAGCSRPYTGKLEHKVHAMTVIAGPGITGEAKLYQEYEGRVRIVLKIEGTADAHPGVSASASCRCTRCILLRWATFSPNTSLT